MRNAFFLTLLVTASVWNLNGQVTASLVATTGSIKPGQTFQVALKLEHRPGWHTYWINPGIGRPTRLDWDLPSRWRAGDIEWPTPMIIRDKEGNTIGNGYDGTVYLPISIVPAKDAPLGSSVTLRATAKWLMCAYECRPGQATVDLSLPVNALVPAIEGIKQEIARMLPEKSDGWTFSARKTRAKILLRFGSHGVMAKPHFFSEDGLIDYASPQRPEANVIELMIGEDVEGLSRLKGVLAFIDQTGTYKGVKLDIPVRNSSAIRPRSR